MKLGLENLYLSRYVEYQILTQTTAFSNFGEVSSKDSHLIDVL